MARELVLYRWRCYCEIRKRWFVTRNPLSEESIKKEYPSAERLDHTRTVIQLSDDPSAMSFASILRNAPLPTDLPPFTPGLWSMNVKKPPEGGDSEAGESLGDDAIRSS